MQRTYEAILSGTSGAEEERADLAANAGAGGRVIKNKPCAITEQSGMGKAYAILQLPFRWNTVIRRSFLCIALRAKPINVTLTVNSAQAPSRHPEDSA